MELKNLINRIDLTSKSKLEKYHNQFTHFIDLLRTRNLNETTISEINKQIDLLNSLDSKDKSLKSQYRKSQGNLLRLLTKEHNLVTQNYYRNTWMMIGIGAIGVPIGTA